MMRSNYNKRMMMAAWPAFAGMSLMIMVMVILINHHEGTKRSPPLLTVCEIGEGVVVALLGPDGSLARLGVTDIDGNYRFTAAGSAEFPGNALRLGVGTWPVHLAPGNFSEQGRLYRYQLMQPDVQWIRVPAGGQAALDEYMALVNSSDGTWGEEEYAFLEEERLRLTSMYMPCFEFVRRPDASVVYTADVVFEEGLTLYAESSWPDVRGGSGVISATDGLVVTAGPIEPAGLHIEYDGEQSQPAAIFYTSALTELLRLGPGGGITMTGELRWREASVYRTVGCAQPDKPNWWDEEAFGPHPGGRGIPARTLNFGLGSCMDDWVRPLGGEELLAIDYGNLTITGTATITPSVPVTTATCSMGSVAPDHVSCSVSVSVAEGAITIWVWGSDLQLSETGARVNWVGVGER